MKSYDYLIVGAGFSGAVMAERLSSQLGKSSLLIDARSHIGGNAYDCNDAAGVLIHKYGPHYFRTNSQLVIDYLSQFTEWHVVDYKVLSYSNGRFWSFPINLKTFEQLIGRAAEESEFQEWLSSKAVHIPNPKNSEEVIVSQVGWDFYEKFFKGYTIKQWNRSPKDLDASVCGRIPIRTNRDDRYLREKFQALPKEGYSKMFDRILRQAKHCEIRLNTSYEEICGHVSFGHLIYTGAIDEFFGHCYGKLPYRSLKFEAQSFTPRELQDRESISGKKFHWQPEMQVNYPNDNDFTRIVEIKHATGQDIENTTIVREYPQASGDPYYPVPTAESKALYDKYEDKASTLDNTTFLGRLGTYRYYNMDQVVAMTLTEFNRIKKASERC
jgi:UDP-galactopyranose mutase